jgi:PNKP adenylyltransferase domain, ligase domain
MNPESAPIPNTCQESAPWLCASSRWGIEGLERFVQREPLRAVHECVFGVLALESEPVDPRL